MAANARTLIQDALDDLAVLTEGVELTASEMQKALRRLNRWRDSLGVQRGTMYEILFVCAPITVGQCGYSIGSGGLLDTPRPTWIDHAGLVIDSATVPSTEVPLRPLTDDEWVTWSPVYSGQPSAYYFDHRFAAGLGNVYLVPTPASSSHVLNVYVPGAPVAEFADLSTSYSFPFGYERFIQKHLALELAPMFKATPSRELVQQAVDARESLVNSNVRPVRRESDPALVGCSGLFDIENGRRR